MSATKTQLIGGGFQDSLGNPLQNGTLKLHLSQDCLVFGVGTICSGIDIIIQLDSNGNVASSASTPPAANQFVWSNLAMSPQNNFYRVTGFTAEGQRAFGPNNQQVGLGATFNLDSWVPNTVISWFPSTQQALLLEVNGVPNAVQTEANFESTDSSITITDEGNGSINFQAANSGPVIIGSPGFGGFFGPGLDFYFGMQNADQAVDSNLANGSVQPAGTLICYQFVLPYSLTVGRATTQSLDNTFGDVCQFGIYNSSGNLVLDGRAWAVSGTGQSASFNGTTNVLPTPVTLMAGVYWHAQSSSSGATAVPHFLGWNFPSGGGGTEVESFWVKNYTRAALAANLAATTVTTLSITAASQLGNSLTLTGTFANPGCVGQYVVLLDFGAGNFSNNGNYLCTACGTDTITVTNPNGVSASSISSQINIPDAGLPATLGTLTPFTPSGSNSDGIVCPFYEP